MMRRFVSAAVPIPRTTNARTVSFSNARWTRYSAIMNVDRKGMSLLLKNAWA